VRITDQSASRHDPERPPVPPPPVNRSPSKLTNGTAPPDGASIYRPHSRVTNPHDRPRSIASTRVVQSDAVPRSGPNNVKRASSVRGAAISSPRLESSTNQLVVPLRQAPLRPNAADEIQLLPTRSAPAPPSAQESCDHGVKPTNEHQLRRAPSRPPPPPAAVAKKEVDHGFDMPMRSPSGPPPDPPDSRHRFYSHAVSLSRNASDSRANGHIDKRSVALPRSPQRVGKSNSTRLPAAASAAAGGTRLPAAASAAGTRFPISAAAAGPKRQTGQNVQTVEPGMRGAAAASGAGLTNCEPRPMLPPKPVEKHVNSSPARLRGYRPGINESQC
jgi:hypothetical protein